MVLAALLLAGVACGSDDDGQRTAAYDFSALAAEMDTFIAETDSVDGAGVVIVDRDDGVILESTFGAFERDRVSLIASSSKMITATVLMSLHEQGILDFDEPIANMVGWGEANPTVTTAQLLSNSSGLVGLAPNPAYAPYLCQYFAGGTLQDCARTIFVTAADDDQVIPPDTMFRYGGGQWQVAGGVAESVSGKSWAELVRETLIEPCGLEALDYNNHFTQLPPDPDNLFGYPGGFDGDPLALDATDNPNMEGGVYTNIADYGKLVLMQVRGGQCDGGRVLSEASVQRLHSDRIDDVYGGSTGGGRYQGYGYGWWIDRGSDSGLIVDPGAYGSVAWIDEGRSYGGFLVIEADSFLGNELFERAYPLINEVVDGVRG